MAVTLESAASGIIVEMAKTVNLTTGERERIKTLIVSRVEPLLNQPYLNFTAEDQAKNDEQCGKILDLLKSRGNSGATNVELSGCALKYTSRVSDLRAKGHAIHCRRMDGRVFNYRLGVEFA